MFHVVPAKPLASLDEDGTKPPGGAPNGVVPAGGAPYRIVPAGGAPYRIVPAGGAPYGVVPEGETPPYGKVGALPKEAIGGPNATGAPKGLGLNDGSVAGTNPNDAVEGTLPGEETSEPKAD